MPAISQPAADSSDPSRHLVPSAGIVGRSGQILWRTIKAFFDDNVGRLGAALAFYTTIAVVPLMVLAIGLAGFFLDEEAARQRLLTEIEHLAGAQAGQAIRSVENPADTASGLIATLISGGTMLFGAFGVFYHLQEALNSIWRVTAPEEAGVWRMLRHRLFSLATVLATGFLLIVSLIASAALSWLSARTVEQLGLPVILLQVVNNVLSLAMVTFLFAMLFKLLPDRAVHWRHVWLGAGVTAGLFTAGKSALGVYLGQESVTSGYGAAGSLVVLLLWCYYAAQIFFFGAEFTRVTSLSDGGRDFAPLDRPQEKSRSL